ncbi:N-dimethylarginine dimethylaminohydrolase [Sedimentibacter acidaminivorans]|uniref:N-dimethylarginine dimethylaminohydrolase n=1 Tax=Sedimentibacter acidaminivorans TaxID=913099 RepID=A0ABS4G966_9FIRM|nr:arginine deiminase family protein [Sedimentibacter acidaminivorans]MBP1924233.1 N-dimethylarginine dimethylaminohydrolase [Sedimentibacter acidaminivorans]
MGSIDEKPNVIPGDKWFPKETNFEEDMPLYWGDWGVGSEVDDLKAVLMRRPGKEIENFDYDLVRYRDNVDVELFRKQHDVLTQIYKDYGVKVYYVEEQRDDRPNAVYCRDLMFMTPEGAIVTRPGMAARRGEERYVAQALAKLGVPILRTINGDGIFEGANAMWVNRKTVILATSSRTNKSGYEQVEYELKRMGVDDIIHMQIPSSNIHIDGLLNFASNDVAMVHASQVPYDVCNALRKKGIKILEAPSAKEVVDTLGCNFVAIKPGVIVQAANNPMCKKLLEDNGIKVISIEMSEFLKGRGTVHCSTAFLKRG